jgi:uncharacterized membrane protein
MGPGTDGTVRTPGRELASARIRMAVCAGIGVVVCAALLPWLPASAAALIAWDTTASGYVAWSLLSARNLDTQATSRLAVSEDPGRAGLDLLLIAASVASLAGVGLVVVGAQTPMARNISALLAVVSVVAGWALVHTVFTERYARLYYNDIVGGIDFNEPDPPCFRDFTYLAFTIGMTFQVSDTPVTAKPIRATVLRHALLSYLFGSVIIAATINLLVSLAR